LFFTILLSFTYPPPGAPEMHEPVDLLAVVQRQIRLLRLRSAYLGLYFGAATLEERS